MVMTKCDMLHTDNSYDDIQARVHAALVQAAGADCDLGKVTYYKTSARFRSGVDELFLDISKL